MSGLSVSQRVDRGLAVTRRSDHLVPEFFEVVLHAHRNEVLVIGDQESRRAIEFGV